MGLQEGVYVGGTEREEGTYPSQDHEDLPVQTEAGVILAAASKCTFQLDHWNDITYCYR